MSGQARIVVLGYGPQTVVEGTAPQGQALAHHAEVAAIVEGDRGVEAAPCGGTPRATGGSGSRETSRRRVGRRRPPRPSGG